MLNITPKTTACSCHGMVEADMAKKKKDVAVESKPEPVVEEEDITCPVCGKAVGIEVTECPHCGAEFEAEEPEVEAKPAAKQPAVEQSDQEEVTCPACGKPVGIDVSECPHCGAEFEVEEIEETAGPASKPAVKPEPVRGVVYEAEAVDEEGTAECPVCGKMVSLSVSSCPSCGAEFEEEEVEEVIEVEEKPAARAAPSKIAIEPEEVEVQEGEVEPVELEGPTSIMDLRVFGIALIALGIIGSQISFMIDWYWTWVPPIEKNLGMFIAIPAVVIVVGLLVFMLIKKAAGDGKKVPKQMPGVSLSMFLFGIFALVMVMLWNPINSALQSSSIGVGVVFVVLLVVGVAMIFMGMRATSRSTA